MNRSLNEGKKNDVIGIYPTENRRVSLGVNTYRVTVEPVVGGCFRLVSSVCSHLYACPYTSCYSACITLCIVLRITAFSVLRCWPASHTCLATRFLARRGSEARRRDDDDIFNFGVKVDAGLKVGD